MPMSSGNSGNWMPKAICLLYYIIPKYLSLPKQQKPDLASLSKVIRVGIHLFLGNELITSKKGTLRLFGSGQDLAAHPPEQFPF